MTQARVGTMGHLVANCDKYFDMYSALLEIVMTTTMTSETSDDSGLADTFDYVRISWRDILRLDEDIESTDYKDHPLDSICLGVLESRSFLFKYTHGGSCLNLPPFSSCKTSPECTGTHQFDPWHIDLFENFFARYRRHG